MNPTLNECLVLSGMMLVISLPAAGAGSRPKPREHSLWWAKDSNLCRISQGSQSRGFNPNVGFDHIFLLILIFFKSLNHTNEC